MQTVQRAQDASYILIIRSKGRLSCAVQWKTLDKTSTSGSAVDDTERVPQETLFLCWAGMTQAIL